MLLTSTMLGEITTSWICAGTGGDHGYFFFLQGLPKGYLLFLGGLASVNWINLYPISDIPNFDDTQNNDVIRSISPFIILSPFHFNGGR